MTGAATPIPNRLNAAIVVAQLTLLVAFVIACRFADGWWWVLLAATFVVVANSAFFSIHEASHGVLFSDKRWNRLAGTVLALFMPASFELLRRVHLAHHVHNRSDEEVFDLYFEGENALWKRLQFYGILTGAFWLVVVASNVLLAVLPMRSLSALLKADRPSAAVMAYLDRHTSGRLRAEAWVVVVLHAAVAYWLGERALGYAAVYVAFGVSWSTLQYLHHFGTGRDVLRGAKNVRYGPVLDRLWLNHGWHLTHHLRPSVPWRYLPAVAGRDEKPTESFARAYFRMWRGPKLTRERIANRYDGCIARD